MSEGSQKQGIVDYPSPSNKAISPSNYNSTMMTTHQSLPSLSMPLNLSNLTPLSTLNPMALNSIQALHALPISTLNNINNLGLSSNKPSLLPFQESSHLSNFNPSAVIHSNNFASLPPHGFPCPINDIMTGGLAAFPNADMKIDLKKNDLNNPHSHQLHDEESADGADEDGVQYSTGRWTKEEHERFLEALKKYGKEWKKVQEFVGTRSSTQARSHAQKFFVKIEKNNIPLHKILNPQINSPKIGRKKREMFIKKESSSATDSSIANQQVNNLNQNSHLAGMVGGSVSTSSSTPLPASCNLLLNNKSPGKPANSDKNINSQNMSAQINNSNEIFKISKDSPTSSQGKCETDEKEGLDLEFQKDKSSPLPQTLQMKSAAIGKRQGDLSDCMKDIARKRLNSGIIKNEIKKKQKKLKLDSITKASIGDGNYSGDAFHSPPDLEIRKIKSSSGLCKLKKEPNFDENSRKMKVVGSATSIKISREDGDLLKTKRKKSQNNPQKRKSNLVGNLDHKNRTIITNNNLNFINNNLTLNNSNAPSSVMNGLGSSFQVNPTYGFPKAVDNINTQGFIPSMQNITIPNPPHYPKDERTFSMSGCPPHHNIIKFNNLPQSNPYSAQLSVPDYYDPKVRCVSEDVAQFKHKNYQRNLFKDESIGLFKPIPRNPNIHIRTDYHENELGHYDSHSNDAPRNIPISLDSGMETGNAHQLLEMSSPTFFKFKSSTERASLPPIPSFSTVVPNSSLDSQQNLAPIQPLNIISQPTFFQQPPQHVNSSLYSSEAQMMEVNHGVGPNSLLNNRNMNFQNGLEERESSDLREEVEHEREAQTQHARQTHANCVRGENQYNEFSDETKTHHCTHTVEHTLNTGAQHTLNEHSFSLGRGMGQSVMTPNQESVSLNENKPSEEELHILHYK